MLLRDTLCRVDVFRAKAIRGVQSHSITFVFAALWTTLGVSHAAAQAPIFLNGTGQRSLCSTTNSDPTVSETATIDVSVVDSHGKPVRGLSEQDFTVLEDGRTVSPASFHAVDSKTEDQGPPDSRAIIVFDNMRMRWEDSARIRAAIRTYLLRNNANLHQPTELLAVTQQGLVVVQDFTQDGKALVASLGKLHPHLNLPYYPVYKPDGQPDGYHGDFYILRQIAESLQQLPGRKTVLWISSGTLWNCSKRKPNIELSNLLFKSRITVSTLDPRGDYLSPGAYWDLSAIQNSVYTERKRVSEAGSVAAGSGWGTLAIETGGQTLFGSNRLNDEIREISRALDPASPYYTLLLQTPAAASQVAFHRIEVRVNRPGLTVNARKGYYGVTEASQAKPSTTSEPG